MTKEEQDKIRRHPAYAEGWRTHRLWYENGQNWPGENLSRCPREYTYDAVATRAWTIATWSATNQECPQEYGWPRELPPLTDPVYEQVQLGLFD